MAETVKCENCGKDVEFSMHGWCSDCIYRLIADARNRGRTPPQAAEATQQDKER